MAAQYLRRPDCLIDIPGDVYHPDEWELFSKLLNVHLGQLGPSTELSNLLCYLIDLYV